MTTRHAQAGERFADLPGIELWTLEPRAKLTVRVERAYEGAAALDETERREWSRLCAQNPRLFDAPLLSVSAIDAQRGEIVVRTERYARLAIQPAVKTGVLQLSVTALVMMEHGSRVLVGRRGLQTRIYPGMWEIGPAGGVDVSEPVPGALSRDDLAAQLVREIEEESGLEIDAAWAEPVGVVLDEIACSYDVVFRVVLPPGADAALHQRENWEYGELRAMEVQSLRAMERGANGATIIDASRAIIRRLV